MKKECSRDQLDYCAGNKYKSGDHTMCKYCVSRKYIVQQGVSNPFYPV